jgi:ethanolamine utilization microcompartment shell protein EutL
MRKATLVTGAVAAAVAGGLLLGGPLHHSGAAPAGASVPTALQLADHALSTVVGPDDEGSYALIDPIGPGGVASVEAADEVFASTLQGGKYHPWQAYRDPFAPQPGGPPGTPAPYKPPSGGMHGGAR